MILKWLHAKFTLFLGDAQRMMANSVEPTDLTVAWTISGSNGETHSSPSASGTGAARTSALSRQAHRSQSIGAALTVDEKKNANPEHWNKVLLKTAISFFKGHKEMRQFYSTVRWYFQADSVLIIICQDLTYSCTLFANFSRIQEKIEGWHSDSRDKTWLTESATKIFKAVGRAAVEIAATAHAKSIDQALLVARLGLLACFDECAHWST